MSPPSNARVLRLSEGARCELHEHFIAAADTRGLFEAIAHEVPFAQRPIVVFGREVMQPRLTAWVGDPEAVYRYSNVRHEPLPFGPVLDALRKRIAACVGTPFNSVLCNLYRHGDDAMGMHSDAEPELGRAPVIASLSLGGARRFLLRPRRRGALPALDLRLTDGSLLVMRGTLQSEFKHGVPRERGPCAPRINLTFRQIFPTPTHPSPR